MLSKSSQWPMCPCHLFPLLKKEKPGTGIFSGAVEVRILRGALYLTAPYFYGAETNGSHAKNHCSKEGTGIMMPFLCPISPHLICPQNSNLLFCPCYEWRQSKACGERDWFRPTSHFLISFFTMIFYLGQKGTGSWESKRKPLTLFCCRGINIAGKV